MKIVDTRQRLGFPGNWARHSSSFVALYCWLCQAAGAFGTVSPVPGVQIQQWSYSGSGHFGVACGFPLKGNLATNDQFIVLAAAACTYQAEQLCDDGVTGVRIAPWYVGEDSGVRSGPKYVVLSLGWCAQGVQHGNITINSVWARGSRAETKCPANSTSNGLNCTCDYGYAPGEASPTACAKAAPAARIR